MGGWADGGWAISRRLSGAAAVPTTPVSRAVPRPLHPSSGLFPARPECQPLRPWRQSLRNAVEIGEAARSTGSSRGIEIPRSAITSLRDGGWVDGRMADGRSRGDFPRWPEEGRQRDQPAALSTLQRFPTLGAQASRLLLRQTASVPRFPVPPRCQLCRRGANHPGQQDGRMADGRSQGDFPVPPRCRCRRGANDPGQQSSTSPATPIEWPFPGEAGVPTPSALAPRHGVPPASVASASVASEVDASAEFRGGIELPKDLPPRRKRHRAPQRPCSAEEDEFRSPIAFLRGGRLGALTVGFLRGGRLGALTVGFLRGGSRGGLTVGFLRGLKR